MRERLDDVPLLLCHFLKELDVEITLKDDALEALAGHDWPGNVRELKNLAERIAVMHTGGNIGAQALTGLLNTGSGKKSPALPGARGDAALPNVPGLPEKLLEQNFSDAKESFEKCYLEFQLLKNNGIISKTAEAIGIYPSNLHAKLKKYGIAAQTRGDQ